MRVYRNIPFIHQINEPAYMIKMAVGKNNSRGTGAFTKSFLGYLFYFLPAVGHSRIYQHPVFIIRMTYHDHIYYLVGIIINIIVYLFPLSAGNRSHGNKFVVFTLVHFLLHNSCLMLIHLIFSVVLGRVL